MSDNEETYVDVESQLTQPYGTPPISPEKEKKNVQQYTTPSSQLTDTGEDTQAETTPPQNKGTLSSPTETTAVKEFSAMKPLLVGQQRPRSATSLSLSGDFKNAPVTINSLSGIATVTEEREEAQMSLVEQYAETSDKLDNFFFDKVEGLFEYILFLFLYQQLDILGVSKEGSQNEPTSQSESSFSSDEASVGGQAGIKRTVEGAPISPTIEELNNPNISDCNNFGNQHPNAKNILIEKLYEELNHDFKGTHALDEMDKIREVYMDYLSIWENTLDNSNGNSDRYYSLVENSGEWNFYINMLEYFIEDCGGFNDLTMIRYKSITNNTTDEKTFIMKDINAPSLSVDYIIPLFNPEQFKYRFQDNGTTNKILQNIVYQDEQNAPLDIKVIQNAPSLIDPANMYPYPMNRFYPTTEDQVFDNFQQCHDLNNFSNPNNRSILTIMENGVKQFFSYFGSEIDFSVLNETNPNYYEKYLSSPVKFIVAYGDGVEISQNDFTRYSQWFNSGSDQQGNPFYYKGIRIRDNQGNTSELHVSDIEIPNICSLVNCKYYNEQIKNKPTEKQKSWNRLIDFATFIINHIPNNENGIINRELRSFYFANNTIKKNAIVMVIIALKSFGDSFQVFYSTAIQRIQLPENQGFQNIANQTYISSSDKNVGAEKMFYKSPFLLNGCGIAPYQSLRERYPYFFDNDFKIPVSEGDVGNGYEDNVRTGASKAILTNIKQENRSYKPSIQLLSNNILAIIQTINTETEVQQIVNQIITPTDANDVSLTMDNITSFAYNVNELDFEIFMQNTSVDDIIVKINNKLQKIYNSLKLIKQQDSILDEKIDTFLNTVDKQNELLVNLINTKHEPTTKELEKLVNRLEETKTIPNTNNTNNTNTTINLIDQSLDKLINVSCLPSSAALTMLQDKFNSFKEKVKDKLNQKKQSLSVFINTKIASKESTIQRASRITKNFLNGGMDFIGDRKHLITKLRELATGNTSGATQGGKFNKTIKHRTKKNQNTRREIKVYNNKTADKKSKKNKKKTRRNI